MNVYNNQQKRDLSNFLKKVIISEQVALKQIYEFDKKDSKVHIRICLYEYLLKKSIIMSADKI